MFAAPPLLALGLASSGEIDAVAAIATARVDAVDISKPNAVRINGAPNEDEWRLATPVDAFVQREPTDAAQPSQRTEFRVAYDATTLFVKVRAYDTAPEKIISYLTPRDQDSPCDWIRVFVDSYHDRLAADEFSVNPSGVKFDRYWYNDNNSDESWDAVWDGTVSRDQHGGSAEFSIP